MMKSKQSQPSQVNTLHHQGMSLFGGCCRYTQFWAIFQPCKGFFMASFDPALAHIHYLFGMTSKKRHCTSTRDFFLGPRTAQISAAAKRKAGSKAESFEIRSRTLRFCLWFSLVNQYFDLHKRFPGILANWQLAVLFQEKINACLHHLITSIHTNQQYLP